MKISSFFIKPFRYAICFSALLIIFSVFTLLEVFVIPKKIYVLKEQAPAAAAAESENESIDETENEKTAPVITDMSYYDGDIDLKIEKFDENGVVFYVAELKLSDAEYIKTAFAQGTYGKNITDKTSVIAEDNHALFAINGDYCGFRNDGVIMRNGVVLRENPRKNRIGLMIDKDGNLIFSEEKEITAEKLDAENIVQCFSFGPTLVADGEISISSTGKAAEPNPRTAIGQIEPLHYIFIVVDGRTRASKGMTFPQLAEEMRKRGCKIAYNLDGGGSATMWFNGKVVNSPNDGKRAGEREISDIIYIGKEE